MQANKQPNSAECFVCGVQNPVGLKLAIYETGPDEVRATFTPPGHYQGYPGVLHGGIVAAALDEIGGRVVLIGSRIRFLVTARMDVKYRQPTPLGQPLTIIGRLVKDRGRVVLSHAEVRLPDGTVTAEADLTLVEMAESLGSAVDLAALGWQLYPDEVGEARPEPTQ